ncbi:MAG TPA: energy transducer TonB [Lentimicrobium sp.]|nr:energy transducer TonB [Lentimicrobium sp.]
MDKDKIRGIAGTIIFHAILVAALIFLALRTPLPLPEEAGVEVNLGYSDDGMGDIQPQQLAIGDIAPSASAPQTENIDDVVTENNDEAPAIKPVVNPDALYKGKQGSSTQGGDQGSTGKPGDQGKTTGTPDGQGYDGTGGAGGGISFSLVGRTSRQLPKPANTFRERGTVVVTIFVNREGRVTRALAGAKGTTTSSSELRLLAERAAMQARFSPKEDAPEEQRGTITYIFELN